MTDGRVNYGIETASRTQVPDTETASAGNIPHRRLESRALARLQRQLVWIVKFSGFPKV